MKWISRILSKLTFYLMRMVAMTLPVDKNTGLIDKNAVENVSLHYDGKDFYFTAIICGKLVFLKYSVDLENWLRNSNITIGRLCDVWEMEIPNNAEFLAAGNIPITTVKTKLNR